jgi:GNAT superfamily N-acetyltransferase
MNVSINTRVVDASTFEAAFQLLRRFFSEEGFDRPLEEMRASLLEMVNEDSSEVFITLNDLEALGVATVTTSVGLEYGRSAELEDLYVLPKARGRGIASQMINAVCDWCSEREVSVLLVTVTPEGESEHKLLDCYQRRGFTNTGRLILERELVEFPKN